MTWRLDLNLDIYHELMIKLAFAYREFRLHLKDMHFYVLTGNPNNTHVLGGFSYEYSIKKVKPTGRCCLSIDKLCIIQCNVYIYIYLLFAENVTLIQVSEKTSNGKTVKYKRSKMDDSDGEEPAKENTYVEDKSILGRIKRFFKSAYKIIKSLFGLIFLLIIYTLLGAAIFMITEGTEEDGQKEGIYRKREDVIAILLNLSNKLVDTEEFKNKSRNVLIDYEDTVRNTDYSSTGQQVWSFWGSMLFCGTIYTTIGKSLKCT